MFFTSRIRGEPKHGAARADSYKGTIKMFCIMCGANLPDGSNFCNICGKPVTAEPGEQTESPSQPFQRFQPFQGKPHGSRVYRADREPEPRSAYSQAWADDISIQESDGRPDQKTGGWLLNLKNRVFSKNAAAPVSFESDQYEPSPADFHRQPIEKKARRPKPHYYSAGNRTYERKK